MIIQIYIALLLAIFPEANTITLRDNVVFMKSNQVTFTRSAWKLALTLDLDPYDQFITNISEDADKIERTIRQTILKYDAIKTNPNFVLTLKSLEQELSRLKYTYLKLRSKFNNNKFIRNKRSLLPFIGSLFHGLFGVSTDDQINAVRRNVAKLAGTQETILHVLDESLTVLNVTKQGVSENRETINQILTSMEQLHTDLSNFEENIHKELVKFTEFVQTYLQLSNLIQNFKELISRGLSLYEHLEIQLDAVALSHLAPAIIEPVSLASILSEIRSNLPPMLQLPYDENTQLWSYYQNMLCTGMLVANKIIIILHVPVLEQYERFNIYKVINMPIAIQSNSSRTPNTQTLLAKYQLEGTGIAFNTDMTRYAVLTDSELASCSNKALGYCE
ncbi:uncharacterized protein LOC123555201 [Mercenaria mercenaria]|uniref:uncharacterized protein LOC123555201 n=1 Tax=Mercenaria mercenaria TaxID=6596 RepID=UPI00234E5BBC|nr:uncharacterized protein LOC123555201 [Mercenaria mercenaria]